jgi:hypothetical protein
VSGRSLLELARGSIQISGRENIEINGLLLGLTKREIAARFDAIVAFAEIEEFLDAPLKTYSSGMAVRLGFSIAAFSDPDVLLVDEVLAVGDERFAHRSLEKFAEFERAGKTILVVSHDLDLVRRAAGERSGSTEPVALDGLAAAAVESYREQVADGGGAASGSVVSRGGPVPARGRQGVRLSTRKAGQQSACDRARRRLSKWKSRRRRRSPTLFGLLSRFRRNGGFRTNTDIDGFRPMSSRPRECPARDPALALAPGPTRSTPPFTPETERHTIIDARRCASRSSRPAGCGSLEPGAALEFPGTIRWVGPGVPDKGSAG